MEDSLLDISIRYGITQKEWKENPVPSTRLPSTRLPSAKESARIKRDPIPGTPRGEIDETESLSNPRIHLLVVLNALPVGLDLISNQ